MLMAALLAVKLLFSVSLVSFSQQSQSPSLFSLNCTESYLDPPFTEKVQFLLHYLTSNVNRARFINLTVDRGPDLLTGIMQCMYDLEPSACTHCAQKAQATVSTLCPRAHALTAWFNGCHLQYYHHHSHGGFPRSCLEIDHWSCLKTTNLVDQVEFQATVETLLLEVRAGVNMATHHRFSSGKLQYGNGSRVQAFAECVQSLSTTECGVCVEKGIEKLYEKCGGKDAGTVASGCCIVHYENSYFSRADGTGELDSGNESAVTMGESTVHGTGCIGFKAKVALIWGAGAACFLLVLLLVWLLRKSIVNPAKVDGERESN